MKKLLLSLSLMVVFCGSALAGDIPQVPRTECPAGQTCTSSAPATPEETEESLLTLIWSVMTALL